MTNPQNDPCSVEDCPSPRRGKGRWCNKHRLRAARYDGDPLGKPALRASTLHARLDGKLERTASGCLIYTGATQSGYGIITETVDGGHRTLKTHRVAYERAYGPIPAGMTVDHECHNEAYARGECPGGECAHRACCEPTHLVPRLMWDNTSRGASPSAVNARKEACPTHEVAYIVYRVCPCCRDEATARHKAKVASMVVARDEPGD